MISVIVPVYNVKQYMREAVDSLIVQSYTETEIILVDDGSTDGSGEICEEYADKDDRIKVIHQKNQGLSAARNHGLDAAQGEIIAFLDPDDVFDKDMLSTLYKAMSMTGSDIVECHYSICNASGRIIGHFPQRAEMVLRGSKSIFLYNKTDIFKMELKSTISVCVWNKLYRRSVWENLRFTEGQNYEDLDIMLDVLDRVETYCVINEELVRHRERAGSITLSRTIKNMTDCSKSYDKYCAFIQAHIPEYYDKNDLMAARQKYYTRLIYEYYNTLLIGKRRSKDVNNAKCIRYLRKRISETKRELDIRKFGFKLRCADFLYFHIPESLHRPVYRMYAPLGKLLYRVGHL